MLVTLTGCSMEWWIKAIIEGDQKHAQQQALTANDIQSRLSPSGHLDLSNLNLWKIPDICSLLNQLDLSRIVSLDLSNNNIQQVSGLDCLPSLADLNLSNNQIDSLLGFPLMENLERLDLARNKLKDLQGIELLTWIIELQLGENFLENLTGLEKLKDLQKIWLELNKLKDLDVLQYLDKLKEVDAKYNELKSDAQDLLDKIPGLNL